MESWPFRPRFRDIVVAVLHHKYPHFEHPTRRAAVQGHCRGNFAPQIFAFCPPYPEGLRRSEKRAAKTFFRALQDGRQPRQGQRRGGEAQYAHGRTRVRPGENSSTSAYALEYARGRTRVRPRAHSSLTAAHSSLRTEYPCAPPPNSRGAADGRRGKRDGNGRFATWAAQSGGQALRATPKKH